MGRCAVVENGLEGIEMAMKGASQMMVQTCLHCRTRLVPFTDGMCPSCGHSIHDSASSVDGPQPRRHPFQFSLRKLLLWTAAWSAYLGFVRWMGVPLPLAIMLTIYLAMHLATRIVMDFEPGLRFWVRITLGVSLGLFGLLLFGLMLTLGTSPSHFAEVFFMVICLSLFVAFVLLGGFSVCLRRGQRGGLARQPDGNQAAAGRMI